MLRFSLYSGKDKSALLEARSCLFYFPAEYCRVCGVAMSAFHVVALITEVVENAVRHRVVVVADYVRHPVVVGGTAGAGAVVVLHLSLIHI